MVYLRQYCNITINPNGLPFIPFPLIPTKVRLIILIFIINTVIVSILLFINKEQPLISMDEP